ncbi:MAG: 16S rRNA (guanine(527)-N(7))-methyltransferase RsmG, partial [Halieaceae bacterium]
ERDSMLAYLALLIKWNSTYNLTAVRDPEAMVVRHLLDSLAIAPLVDGKRMIDVGSGAGLPGVPLAILNPAKEVHLLDSNSKKTRFLFQVKTALGLDNMVVHHQRVESFQPSQQYDVVLSRAFAGLPDMVASCSHLLKPDGVFLAMKGVYPQDELEAVESLCTIEAVQPVVVPDLDEHRHLVRMKLLKVST